MKTPYSERDYTFGQAMLTLRTAIGLTQVELAHYLGVSRRAVGDWETGSSYPKTEHLKELLLLGVEHHAFAAGQEAEEIRRLWKTAHQKVLLDEQWLSTLLDQRHSHHLHLMPKPAEEAGSRVPGDSGSGPSVDWGDALAVPTFYGREEEQGQLSQWIVQEQCRVVSVLGMGGIGKSVLCVNLMYQLAEHFEVVIFRSLRNAPTLDALLDECLQVLSPEPIRTMPATLKERTSLFLEFLRKTRALVVFDNLESLLQEGDVRGVFRPDFLGYGSLLRQVGETAHQSCLLLTSREKLAILRFLEGKRSLVRTLRLSALDTTACTQLLEERELVGTRPEQERLIKAYSGNPLALKIVGETIFDLFGGEIGLFLTEGTTVFGSVTSLLEEQFARLSRLSQSVLCWLAIVREPVTLDELQRLQVTALPRAQLLEAVDAGYQRSLIERGRQAGSFILQSVVLEYVTAFLIAQGSREIQGRRLEGLIQYGLEQAMAREYVRQTQERLLLCPLLAELQSSSSRLVNGGVGGSPLSVEEQLLSLLDGLRGQEEAVQGYGPANLIALLRLLRGNLSGLDFSRLCIRGTYLQGVEMHETKLSRSLMRDTVLTEALSATWVVAISLDGKWWAAGGMQGKVRVWDEKGRTVHLIQAHTELVLALAFSPNGRMLASAGMDDTIKLWDVESGALLWTGWQADPMSLTFAPDSNLLASGGLDATVRVFDTRSGTNLQMLTHPGSVMAVAFSPDGFLLASGCLDGQIRLWERQNTTTGIEILRLSTSWVADPVTNLAFAPSGTILASVSYDRIIRLWEVPSGCLEQVLPGQTDRAQCIVWSPDGRTLACCSYDKAIWHWNVEQRRYHVALHGHTANVHGLAFTPDGSRLLSGGADSTLRVWDVQHGQCIRIIVGYRVSLYDVDWSPDGTHLVSGAMDGEVTVWDLSGGAPPRVLRGHTWRTGGVRWSPDGTLVASSSWDTTVRLWDLTSGACVQVLQSTSASFSALGMAWSPDGRLLACGTLQQGVQVWDMRTRRLRWAEGAGLTLRWVAWSPDSTQLVGGGIDNTVYLWNGADGRQIQKLVGHQGAVMSVGWNPNGRFVASGSGSKGMGELFVWDVQNGEHMQSFAGYPGIVYALAWSPNGDQLVSGGGDGKLRWWDVESGQCVRTRDAHEGTIQSLRVSPNGKRLASCGDDGAIMIWDLESGEHLQMLRHDRPYERLDITGIRGLNEAQKESLRALGAIEGDAPSN